MFSKSSTFLSSLAACLCALESVNGDYLVPRNSQSVTLTAPSTPPKGHQVVDAAFQSYSIEFNYMLDYAGNNSHPNEFSYQILQNFKDIAGAYPVIRVGGTTQNRAVYLSNQTDVGLKQTFSRPWDDQPSKLTVGPKWFESFYQFPKGIKYIYGLNFYNTDWGLNNTVTQGVDAYLSIGKDLYAYEIGNEPNGWAGSSRRPANWTIHDYIDEWTEYSEALRDEIRKHPGHESYTPQIQGCAFTAPRKEALSSSSSWNVANVVRLGMGESEMLKTVADHDYMGANCVGAPVPTLKNNLLNHHHMTSLMYYHEVLGNQLEELGVPYVLGETNSISCQGTRNVSDVYGAALWAVDYVLYVAGLKVSRLYFHMGSPYRYAPWQPTAINGTAPFAKPLFYGNLFAATALAGGNKQVVSIANETTFAAYGIYDARSHIPKLESVAIINLEMFNSTQPAAERLQKAVKLPTVGTNRVQPWRNAKVRRLTASGVEVKTGVSFAGRKVDGSGKLVGKEQVEKVHNGEVLVGAGEAVLVTL